jgi:hypothetical protein
MPTYPTRLSPLPVVSFSTSAFSGAGGVIEFDPAPYSNTKEVVVFNPATDASIIVRVAPVYPAIDPVDPDYPIDAAHCTIIPPGGSFTFAIGPEGYRNPLATAAFWATSYGSYLNFVVDVAAPVTEDPFSVNVTYIQCPGGGGGVSV